MYKKILSLLLLIIIMAAFIIACANDSGGNNDDTKETSSADDDGIVDENKPWTFGDVWKKLDDNLPDKNYNGESFNILTMDYQYADLSIIADEQNGDVLNDAIYKRTSNVEEEYNIVITSTLYTDFWDTGYVKKLVSSGDTTYNLIWMIDRFALAAAMENCLYPLQDIPYIDLTRPYWGGEKMISLLTINGIMYFAVPDYNLIGYNNASDIMFNKNMYGNLQLDDPYEMVLNGTWTYDRMLDLAHSAVSDLNGDGIPNEGDSFGLICGANYLVYNFFNASDIYTVLKDESDLPYFALPGNQKASDIYDKVFRDYYGTDVFFSTMPKEDGTGIFKQRQALFFLSRILKVFILRDMEDDFGLLPLPKYDEVQEDYLTPIESLFFSVVPTTVVDIERTGIILEALACASYNIVVPEYYEKCLTTKLIRDDESAGVIGIILKNRVTDFGNVFFADDIDALIFSDKKQEYSSFVEKLSSKVDAKLAKAIEYFTSVS